MKYRSCAEWPPGHVVGAERENVTTDTHDTESQAKAVCKLLEREGFSGERCHFPVKTWVEKDEGK